MTKPKIALRSEIKAISKTSLNRLLAWVRGDDSAYRGAPVAIYLPNGGTSSYVPFDDGLFRHDVHVVLHGLFTLAGFRWVKAND